MKFKFLSEEEKPREKAIKKGLKALSNTELLALFLRTGSKKNSVLVLAQKFLENIHGLRNLVKLEYQEIVKMPGIGKAKALELLGAFELVRRINFFQAEKTQSKINNPNDVYKLMKYAYENVNREHFYVILLDKTNHIINKQKLFQGTKNQILIDLKDIFAFIFINKGKKIICVHNHPSGNSLPSTEDFVTTQEIKEICQKLNIFFIDHIIFGKKEYYSIGLEKKYFF